VSARLSIRLPANRQGKASLLFCAFKRGSRPSLGSLCDSGWAMREVIQFSILCIRAQTFRSERLSPVHPRRPIGCLYPPSLNCNGLRNRSTALFGGLRCRPGDGSTASFPIPACGARSTHMRSYSSQVETPTRSGSSLNPITQAGISLKVKRPASRTSTAEPTSGLGNIASPDQHPKPQTLLPHFALACSKLLRIGPV